MTMRSVTLTRFSTSSLTWLLLTLNPYIYKVYRGARKSASFVVFSTFIKILFPCTSLVPYLVLPKELRETTEGRPKELPANKKCFFLRWVPIKLFPFLKNRPKIRFLFAYLQNKVLLLRRKLSKVKNKIE